MTMAQQAQTTDDEIDPTVVDLLNWCYSGIETADDQKKPLKYLRITGLPKKIDARTLTSMIVTTTMIAPRKVQIACLTQDLNGPKVGHVEYKNPVDAHRAAEKFRSSPSASKLTVKITTEPEMIDLNNRP